MIIDYSDPKAQRYEILDAETGQPLLMDDHYKRVRWADDEAGILRIVTLNADGKPYLAYRKDHHTPIADEHKFMRHELRDGIEWELQVAHCVAWHEEKKAINIVLKSDLQETQRLSA